MSRRGLTLVEVMVASGIFMGASLLVLVIMRVGRLSEDKGQVHSDAHRVALVAIERIRAELYGGIVSVARSSTEGHPGELIYLYVPRDNSVVPIDTTGHPSYSGPATLTMQETHLVRQEDSDPLTPGLETRPLVDLGVGGKVDFIRNSTRMLEVTVKAVRPDPTNPGKPVEYQHRVELFLENQP